MAKIQIYYPTNEMVCGFPCPDLQVCATDHGITLIAEKDNTTIRIVLDWGDVETVLTKAKTHLRNRTTTPVPWPAR